MPKAQQKINKKQRNMAQSTEQNKTLGINPNETQSCLTLISITTITKQKITNDDKDLEKLEPLCTIEGAVKWCNCYGKLYGRSFKMKNTPPPDSLNSVPLWP